MHHLEEKMVIANVLHLFLHKEMFIQNIRKLVQYITLFCTQLNIQLLSHAQMTLIVIMRIQSFFFPKCGQLDTHFGNNLF